MRINNDKLRDVNVVNLGGGKTALVKPAENFLKMVAYSIDGTYVWIHKAFRRNVKKSKK